MKNSISLRPRLIFIFLLLFQFSFIYANHEKYALEPERLNCVGTSTKYISQSNKPDITIIGRVTDVNGEALKGVKVTVKQTGNSTLTNETGNYSIDVPSDGTLIYSLIDFQKQEIVVDGKTVINVILERQNEVMLDALVVTGRAGTSDRTKLSTSYSITSIDNEALSLQSPTSVTETLKSVPGFWVESSGGEASGNVRARGVPVDGYGSIQLLEDGVPVQHDPALGYLNADQAFRFDETIQNIEVVRGGPSSIFYSNAPAGAVNYIPRKVYDTTKGILKFTAGNGSLYRTDFWIGTPIDTWKMTVGGFYRSGEGIRDPGFTGNQGGQMRVSLGRKWEKSSFNIDYKYLDDDVMLYLGIPMTYKDGEIVAVPGFDGNYGTVAGKETLKMKMIQGDNSTYDFDNSIGTSVKRNQITTKFSTEFIKDWKLKNTTRYSSTITRRNGVFPNALQTASEFLISQEKLISLMPNADHLKLQYVSDGSAFNESSQNGNGLLIIGGLRGLTMPVNEITSDLQISHIFKNANSKHDINLGYYFSHFNEDFSRYSSSVLLDVQNNSRLLDLVSVDQNGNILETITNNGIYRYGYEWEDAHGEQTTNALYVSDEWQINKRLRIDAGLRWENVLTQGVVAQKKSIDLGSFPSSNILTSNGKYGSYNQDFNFTTWSLGTNYEFGGNMGVFGRITSAARIPGLGNYITNVNAKPTIQKMTLGEIGYKFINSKISLFATGFWTKYKSVGFVNYVFDINGESVAESLFANTKTIGLEFEGMYNPVEWFDISTSATIQNAKYDGLEYTDSNNISHDYSDNQLIRIPATSLRIVPGFNLLDNKLRMQGVMEYQGKRYVDIANSKELPSYVKLDVNIQADITNKITIFGIINNLNNSLGLTEGNPRQGEIQNSDALANSFIARPLIGRNFKIAVRIKF